MLHNGNSIIRLQTAHIHPVSQKTIEKKRQRPLRGFLLRVLLGENVKLLLNTHTNIRSSYSNEELVRKRDHRKMCGMLKMSKRLQQRMRRWRDVFIATERMVSKFQHYFSFQFCLRKAASSFAIIMTFLIGFCHDLAETELFRWSVAAFCCWQIADAPSEFCFFRIARIFQRSNLRWMPWNKLQEQGDKKRRRPKHHIVWISVVKLDRSHKRNWPRLYQNLFMWGNTFSENKIHEFIFSKEWKGWKCWRDTVRMSVAVVCHCQRIGRPNEWREREKKKYNFVGTVLKNIITYAIYHCVSHRSPSRHSGLVCVRSVQTSQSVSSERKAEEVFSCVRMC